jgi:hypothetical protein
MIRPTKTVHPVDFSVLGGTTFERLVYAFLYRRWLWSTLDWFGQVGDDDGLDIVGVRDDEWGRPERVVVACANWRNLTASKGKGDIDKFIAAGAKPDALYVIAGGQVAASTRTAILQHAKAKGIAKAEIWSGPELEERLRLHAPSVLRRMFDGDDLPEAIEALRTFTDVVDDEAEALRRLAPLLDRPSFYTPFHNESSLPAFRKAISDTVEALNTGIWRSRDGTPIGRVPSRHDFASNEVKAALNDVVNLLLRLRAAYDTGLADGSIQRCGCANPECPTHTIRDDVATRMDAERRALLAVAATVIPDLPAWTPSPGGRW